MDARAFCFAVDVVDDLHATLQDILALKAAGRPARSAGVVLAASYHAARDFLPHNARRRVHYSPAGVAFPPDLGLYPAQLPPHPLLPVCADRDVLAETVAEARANDMRADAWVVYLHHDAPDIDAIAGRVVNAFGDSYPVALCPASPLVQDYAIALTTDVCSRRPDGIFAEAIHYQPLGHGFHHERTFHRLGGLATVLLAICFCSSCTAAASAVGLDVNELRAWVRSFVDGPEGQSAVAGKDELCARADAAMAPGTLAKYLALRAGHTSRLVGACAETASLAGVEFTMFDATRALAEQHSVVEASTTPGWQIGVELSAIAKACEVATAFYVESVAELATQLAQVTAEVGSPVSGAILRPMGDDLRQGADLAEAVRRLQSVGTKWIGYYHYGLAPDSIVSDIRRIHSSLGTN